MTGEHSFLRHTYEMRCENCGKVVTGAIRGVERCACKELRCFSCSVCGFRMMTGGPSLVDMLEQHHQRTAN